MRRTALAPLLLFACTDASPCPPGDLCHAPRTIPLSTVPLDARYIDLDGDAHLDLVGVGTGAFILRRGAADGTLAAPELLAAPGSDTALVTGDFDGDGRPDALTAVPSLPALAWLRDTHDLRVLPIAAAYSPLAVADLDGDGDDDVIAATPHSVHVLLGGEHGPSEQSRLELDDRGAIAIGDLADDGGLDLAVVRPLRGAVDRFTITESGAITRVGTLWRTEFPTAVTFADLDDDGALDLAAADRLARVVRISLGDGAGAFLRHTDFNVDLEPVALVARRGPHGRELAVTGADLDTLQLLDPTSGARRISAFVTTTAVPDAVDLDGDGVDELVRGESRLDEIPGFAATRTWTAAPGRETGRITLADLDDDGARELVAHDPRRAELIVHTADGLELSRAPAPPTLAGLRPLDGVDGPSIAWWSRSDLSVRTGDITTTTSFAPFTILDVVADPADLYVATTELSLTAAVWRIHRNADGSLSAPERVFTGPTITSLTLATPGDPWISHAGGVSRLPNRTVSPLRNLTGATLVDLDDDDTLALVGCRDDGLFVAREGAPSERLTTTPCTRVDACDLDDDGVLELLVTHGRGAAPLSPGYTALEVLARTDDTWTRRGAFTLGLQADHLALACDDLTVWTGGPLGLARADLHPGPALRETSVRLPPRLPLLGDLDGDGRDELLADDGRHLLLARPSDDLPRLLPATTATPVALAELDGTPGREVLARTTDLDGVTTHAIWSLRGDTFVRTGMLAEPDLELTILDLFADFDGDGRDELLTRSRDVPRILRVDARGAATLLASDPVATPNILRAADMNRDGRADLLLPVFEAGFPIDVRLSRGDGSFAPPHRWHLGLDSIGGNNLAVGDLDQNGTHDLAYVDARGAAILICPGNGHGGPAAACRRIAWDPDDSSVAQPVIGDFDGDGAPDLVIAASTGPTLHLLRGDGAGRLVMAPKLPLSTAGPLRRARADIGALWLQLAPGRAVVLTAEAR